MKRIVGSEEWLEEYRRVCKEGKVVLLFGKGMEGVNDAKCFKTVEKLNIDVCGSL